MKIKNIILVLCLLNNVYAMNKEQQLKVFPQTSCNIYYKSIINAFSYDTETLFQDVMKTIEEANRSYYTEFSEAQESLFEELKDFFNYEKKTTEQLSDSEIRNILNLFLNDINNFEIKHHNKAKKQTFYHHIKSKEQAEQICKNLVLIINQQTIENKILTRTIKIRLNQLKQKYKITGPLKKC